MADEREEQEGEPKIRIVDRRMLTDDERAGKGATGGAGAPPKLEIVGGGRPDVDTEEDTDISASNIGAGMGSDAGAAEDHGMDEELGDEYDEPPLTEEEQMQMREEIERQQFEAIEQRMGRPLTEQEKEAVRGEMDRQAQSMASLEILPVLQNFMAEMSSMAAVHMGLMPNPYTRLIARNDTQARLAIDSFAAVLEVARPQVDPSLFREFERVLNDLRVNFVSITGGSIGGPGAGPMGGPRIIH